MISKASCSRSETTRPRGLELYHCALTRDERYAFALRNNSAIVTIAKHGARHFDVLHYVQIPVAAV
jgi:hypothetical protein